MNTKVLEYFIAAAEEQNISRAAERCFISQPALSQHIKELEKQLGVPLFTRTGHSVALTDFGRVYLNNAHAILRTEQQTLDKIKALRESLQSHLRIITTERMKSILEHSIFPELKSQHPSVTISLLTGTADTSITSLLQDTADVGILEAAEELPPELIDVCLVRQEYALAVPFGHSLTARRNLSSWAAHGLTWTAASRKFSPPAASAQRFCIAPISCEPSPDWWEKGQASPCCPPVSRRRRSLDIALSL